jgi:hypothetical protein
LVYAIGERVRVREWPALSSFILSGTISAGMVALLVWIGAVTASQPIAYSRGWVTVGKGPAATVLFVDRHVMGSLYGHTFRRFVAMNPGELSDGSYCFVESVRDLPRSSIKRVIVSGRFAGENDMLSRFAQGTRVILVNPGCSPDEAKWDGALTEKTTVYFGEYSQSPTRSFWSNVPGLKPRQIDGASDFVPSWPQVILSAPKT